MVIRPEDRPWAAVFALALVGIVYFTSIAVGALLPSPTEPANRYTDTPQHQIGSTDGVGSPVTHLPAVSRLEPTNPPTSTRGNARPSPHRSGPTTRATPSPAQATPTRRVVSTAVTVSPWPLPSASPAATSAPTPS